MTGVAKVKALRKVTPNMEYYSVRMDIALIAHCKLIAEAETKRNGWPVATAAVMRKFIQVGVDQWEKEKAQRG